MNMKVHRAPDGEVVAVCDSDLVNRKLRHGDVDVLISSGFYGDREATDEEVRDALGRACNINLFGRRAVELAREMGLVDEASCLEIDGVPHVQVYVI